jgi:protein-arginine kinase
MDKPMMPNEVSSTIQRDWPDARGIWLSQDRSLRAYLNRKDHVLLSTIKETNNFQVAYDNFREFIKNVNLKIYFNF